MGKTIPAIYPSKMVQQAEVDDMKRAKATLYAFFAAHRRVRRDGMRENPLFFISLDIVRSIGKMVLSEVYEFYATVMNPHAVYLFFGMFLPGNEQWMDSSVSPLLSPGFHASDHNGDRICFVGNIQVRAGATSWEIEEELRAQFSLIDSGLLQCCIGMPRFSSDGRVIDFTTDDWVYDEWDAHEIAYTVWRLSGELDIEDESSDIVEGYNAIDMFWIHDTFEFPRDNKRRKTLPLPGQATFAEDQVDGPSGDEE